MPLTGSCGGSTRGIYGGVPELLSLTDATGVAGAAAELLFKPDGAEAGAVVDRGPPTEAPPPLMLASMFCGALVILADITVLDRSEEVC